MADYKLTNSETVIRTSDGAAFNPGHRFYDEFLIWKSAGGIPDPAPPEVTVVPQSISDRQFFQQLAIVGIITQQQALDSNRGIIPQPMLDIIEQMPDEVQFNAKMIVSGATVYNREDPLTIGIGTAYGMSSDQIDEFFAAAAAL